MEEKETETKQYKLEKKYTSSLFYEVLLTGKYIKKMGEKVFKKFNLNITTEEFSALDFIYESCDTICQRDLALKMLINRPNMGKILNSLEEKGYVKNSLSLKGKRPVKLASLTEEGKKFYVETIMKFKEHSKNVLDRITKEESDDTILVMHKIRETLKETVGADI